jgi:alanine racemase
VSTSRLEIDLGAIERNFARVARIVGPGPDRTIGGAGICAVLKQDAYGMGAARIARRLAVAGARMFAAYNLDEARGLFESVPDAPILVLMPVAGVDRNDPLYRAASGGRLHLVIHDLDQLVAVSELAGRVGVSMPVHVQVDTGLSRGGERPDEAARIVERVLTSSRVRLAGLMTHFSSPGDDPAHTDGQWNMFREFVDRMSPVLKSAVTNGHGAGTVRGAARGNLAELEVHAANSCGAFRSRRYHGTMVRIGEALYGMVGGAVWGKAGPGIAEMEFGAAAVEMEPAVRWTSTISHIEEIPAGWPVGYGSTWQAPKRTDGKPTRIALIPVGYADGYPRSLGGALKGGPGMVGFTGRKWDRRTIHATHLGPHEAGYETLFAPIVGRVSMDQITVDVTDLPESHIVPGRAGLDLAGSEVELVGVDPSAPNHLPALASAGGTIAHEMLCRMGPRLERVYRYTGVAHAAAAGTREGAKTTTVAA